MFDVTQRESRPEQQPIPQPAPGGDDHGGYGAVPHRPGWVDARGGSPGGYRWRSTDSDDDFFATGLLEVAMGYVAAQVMGPLAQGLLNRLGELLAESVTASARRLRLVRREQSRTLMIEGAHATTILRLPDELSEEAKLALLDLDVTAENVRGHLLEWNVEAKAWHPVTRAATLAEIRERLRTDGFDENEMRQQARWRTTKWGWLRRRRARGVNAGGHHLGGGG